MKQVLVTSVSLQGYATKSVIKLLDSSAVWKNSEEEQMPYWQTKLTFTKNVTC